MEAADAAPEQAFHELLLRLAGRLPDMLLWRLRDWLPDSTTVVATLLPRELLRHRIGLSDDERERLAASARACGAPHRLLDAVLPLPATDGPVAAFLDGPGIVDGVALSVLAVVRSHPGCVELRQAWRRTGGQGDQRVVVVHGAERPWVLTAVLQRVLRAHGDRTPCVEVLPPHGEPTDYHRAAIIDSTPLWHSAALAGA